MKNRLVCGEMLCKLAKILDSINI